MTRQSKNVYELYFIAGGYRTFYLGTYSSLAKAKEACDVPQKTKPLYWLPSGNGSTMDLGRNDMYSIERYKRHEVEYEQEQ